MSTVTAPRPGVEPPGSGLSDTTPRLPDRQLNASEIAHAMRIAIDRERNAECLGSPYERRG